MFRFSCEELQRRRATQLIQYIKNMFEGLGLNDLVEPNVKVEILTTFSVFLERYALILNHEGGGERLYAFKALRLLKAMCAPGLSFKLW